MINVTKALHGCSYTQAITEQLRRRGIDILTAIDDEAATLSDDELLARASSLGRVLFYPRYSF